MAHFWHLLRALARRGPRFIYMYFRDSMLWDLQNGTSTHMRVPKPDDGGDEEKQDGLLYVASLTSVVRRTLTVARQHWGAERFDRARFVDLGCGKGKTLLVYAKDVADPAVSPPAVGIEYDAELTRIAQANVAKMVRPSTAVEVHCDSAANLAQYVGADEDLVVYLYNSFQGETLRKVLSELASRPHILIYVDPVERDTLGEFGYTTIRENRGRYNADTWLVAERS